MPAAAAAAAVEVGPGIRLLPIIMVSTTEAHAQQVVVLLPANLKFQAVLENLLPNSSQFLKDICKRIQ